MYMDGIIHLVFLYMGDIYSFGIIVPWWYLLIWCYCTWVAFIHLVLLYMGGIYSF